MFDLFRSRDKAVRIFLTVLLSLVALSMITYLIPGSGATGVSAADNIVAEVGKTPVTVHEVQLAIRNASRNREMPPEMMVHLIPQIIDQIINEKALVYQAEQMGLTVTEADTAKAIRITLPNLFPNGVFVGKEAYAAAVAQNNMTIPEFEDYMRQQLILNRLRSVVLESTVVSKADIEQEFRLNNEKAGIEFAKVDPVKMRADIKLTPEEMKAYYDVNKASLKVGEKRALKLVVLDPARIAESVAVTEAQVRLAYEQNKERYRTPERVHARHILLMTSGKPPEEEPKAKAKADDLLKQLKAGANFADLAGKNSDDPGSKDKGGDLSWVVRGQTVPEFEQALYALKPNEISGVVKTQYGYHIIQAIEKEQANLKAFDQVKDQLANELKVQLGSAQVQSAMDNLIAGLKKNPQQVEQIAAQFRATVVNVEKAGAGDPIPEIGVNRDFEDSIAGLKKGDVSQPVAAPGNRQVVAVITDIFPEHPATFEEAQNMIRPTLVQQKAAKQARQKVDELMAKVKAADGDMKKAAQAVGAEYAKPPEFARNGAIEGLGSPDGIPETFTKPVGTIFGPTQVGDFWIVGKITARTPANMAELPAKSAELREDIKRTKARERNALFEDGLRQQMIKEGKIKIHNDVLKRVAETRG